MSEVEFSVNNDTERVPPTQVAVLASSLKAGENYAKLLELKDYVVLVDWQKALGKRFKALIVSPGYFMKVEKARWEAMRLFDTSYQSLFMTGGEEG